MDGEASWTPRERKVAKQGAEWSVAFCLLFVLCLLQEACALKGPRLVSGELGGAVTIQCHYAPLSVNRHQRKYWCRVGPPKWTCHTIVSTNRYTHHGYHGRVALADFPQRSFFVVRLSQLSADDEGSYRCGIGNSNQGLFFSMNLTISAGSSSTIPPAAGEFLTEPSGTTLSAAKRWTPGATQALDGWRMKWDRVVPTTETRKTTASAKGSQTPEAGRVVTQGAESGAEGFSRATALTPQSTVSELKAVFSTAEGVWGRGTGSSVTKRTWVSEGRKEMTTIDASEPGDHTKKAETAGDTTRGAIRPSPQAQEILLEATMVSKQQALVSTEGATSAVTAPRTLDTTHRETASVEGSPEVDPGSTARDQGPQATPSWGPPAHPQRLPDKESSRRSAFPEDERGSWTLAPASTILALFLLVALVPLQRQLWRKRSSWAGSRKDPKSHPDSDGTFSEAEPPTGSAAQREKGDTAG